MNTEWERFSFSSPAIPKAHQGKGLSRPRMTKLRKHSAVSSKPPPLSVIEPGVEGKIIENLDRLSIQGMRTEVHSLEEDLGNLDINAFRDAPFEFGSSLNDAMKNLNIEKPVDTINNAVSSSNSDPDSFSVNSLIDACLNDEMRKMSMNESVVRDVDLNEWMKESATSDNDSNEELRKMDARENDNLDTVDINAFCNMRLSDGMENMSAKESEVGEVDLDNYSSILNDDMRNLNIQESAGTIDETELISGINMKLNLSNEERTPNRFVFTSSQDAKMDKAPVTENAVSKATRAKLKKKGTKQKVHLWSGIDFVSTENKSDDACSPMDISPSPVSDIQESEESVAPFVEAAPAFTFSAPQNSPLRGQRKKLQPIVEIGADECEKWRLKGNLAYKNGDLARAEEFYKEGINSVAKEEASRSCLRALMLCYSNLAATHMSLGRIGDALRDCQEAAIIDPTFYKVQLRAATCHLLLGQVEEAVVHFRRCLSESDVCVDRKIAVEASDGLQRVEKFIKLSAQAGDNSEREAALEAASDALSISPYCEKMHETKAELLFALRRYDAVIAYSQNSLDSAENNSPLNDSLHRRWRFRLAFLSYFRLGKLEDALSLNESGKYGVIEGPMSSLVSKVKDLVRYKAAGNEAMQGGKPSEAIEHYSSAISLSTESRPFAAICFFNRAAAHKSLGNVVDAIADCNLAIALDGNYAKALSRRAALYEMIRDYCDAASDLRRIISSSSSTASDRARLLLMEEEARKEVPLDLYMILGIDTSASNVEVKKAYRKAALRYHPDKAGKVLESVGREIGEEVRQNADKLFKRIGEAYAILSDPLKRSQYDQEEEIRNMVKNRGGSNPLHRRDGRRSYA